MMKLYTLPGACSLADHIVLEWIGAPYEAQVVTHAQMKQAEFLALNPAGAAPVLQVGDHFLPESNAACFWLAEGTRLAPDDRFDRADMLRWMFWEQYNHEPNVATLRFWMGWIGDANLTDVQRALLPGKIEAGKAALALMDEHLAKHDWLAGGALSLADIALYAYTHVAEESGFFALADYPAVQRWLARIEAEPGFVAMEA